MVAGIFNLTRGGLKDWITQRVTAVILAAYSIFIFLFIVTNPHLHYLTWVGLFQFGWMRIFSLLTLISLILHAWIGIWTVITDYLKPIWLRLGSQIIVIILLIGWLIWGIEILWGIY